MPENGEIDSLGGSEANNQAILSTLSSQVTNAVNQLPESQQAGLAGIKELLTQLQNRIEGNADLPSAVKAQAQQKQSDAETALKALRGMFGTLPNATNFVEACSQLLPDIAEIFGLQW